MTSFRTRKLALYFVLIGLAAFAAGYFLKDRADKLLISQIKPVRASDAQFPLINPLLLYQLPNSADLPQYGPLAKTINGKISDLISQNKATQISVYYRDMNEGRWVGVNENEEYTPASLMKVVVLTAYLKEAESNPTLLSKNLTFTVAINSLLNGLPDDENTALKIGSQYTVNQLLEQMIIHSDNGAAYTLLSGIDSNTLNQLYNMLGLGNPAADGRSYVISAQGYSFFFRILYNSTYLSKEMSERALDLLSQTDFKDGLVAGVDQGIQVAHKYGESINTDSSGAVSSLELHDCGIVYEPFDPYFICVMTRGTNLDDLKESVKEISSVVFSEERQINLKP